MLFLPGELDPVASAHSTLKGREAEFAQVLGIERTPLTRALDKIGHVDHHDFCEALANELCVDGRDSAWIRDGLLRLWLSEADVAAEAKALMLRLIDVLAEIPLDT